MTNAGGPGPEPRAAGTVPRSTFAQAAAACPSEPAVTGFGPAPRRVYQRIPNRSRRMTMIPGTPNIQRIPPFNMMTS
jgi:hypothetical protein